MDRVIFVHDGFPWRRVGFLPLLRVLDSGVDLQRIRNSDVYLAVQHGAVSANSSVFGLHPPARKKKMRLQKQLKLRATKMQAGQQQAPRQAIRNRRSNIGRAAVALLLTDAISLIV